MKARRTETTCTGKKNRFSTSTLELKIRSESASITQHPSAESWAQLSVGTEIYSNQALQAKKAGLGDDRKGNGLIAENFY
jgi:hypothetical protein